MIEQMFLKSCYIAKILFLVTVRLELVSKSVHGLCPSVHLSGLAAVSFICCHIIQMVSNLTVLLFSMVGP